jgi:molybdenum cofactor synthesis domain-containing protein
MPLRLALLTVSDACSAGEREDRSGAILRDWVRDDGHMLVEQRIVPDERLTITRTLLSWADGGAVDAILTTGGTGFSPRDVTPEATRPVLDRHADGLAERLRRFGEAQTEWAALSRGLAGARGRVFIANLPGSPGGVRDGIAVLGPALSHICALLRGETPEHTP